jgi:hypothetical protein
VQKPVDLNLWTQRLIEESESNPLEQVSISTSTGKKKKISKKKPDAEAADSKLRKQTKLTKEEEEMIQMEKDLEDPTDESYQHTMDLIQLTNTAALQTSKLSDAEREEAQVSPS